MEDWSLFDVIHKVRSRLSLSFVSVATYELSSPSAKLSSDTLNLEIFIHSSIIIDRVSGIVGGEFQIELSGIRDESEDGERKFWGPEPELMYVL